MTGSPFSGFAASGTPGASSYTSLFSLHANEYNSSFRYRKWRPDFPLEGKYPAVDPDESMAPDPHEAPRTAVVVHFKRVLGRGIRLAAGGVPSAVGAKLVVAWTPKVGAGHGRGATVGVSVIRPM